MRILCSGAALRGYGLLTVCSASKVNVAVVVAFWNALPVLSGSITLKHSVSEAAAASSRSPPCAPCALEPSAPSASDATP